MLDLRTEIIQTGFKRQLDISSYDKLETKNILLLLLLLRIKKEHTV